MTLQDELTEACQHLAKKDGRFTYYIDYTDAPCFGCDEMICVDPSKITSLDWLDELAWMLGWIVWTEPRFTSEGVTWTPHGSTSDGRVRKFLDTLALDIDYPDKPSAAIDAVTAIIYQVYPR